MAEVAPPDQYATHGQSSSRVLVPTGLGADTTSTSETAMPLQPYIPSTGYQQYPMAPPRRPASASMHIEIPSNTSNVHRRTASTLPSFSFNASDISGRQDNETPPRTPDETVAVTPSRAAHRRGGSEFVGGDSRLGISNFVSSSPTKMNASTGISGPAAAPTVGRRGHAHRRSAAISSHDVVKLMQHTTDLQPRLSNSLPNTPLEHPSHTLQDERSSVPKNALSDPFGPLLESPPARPPSRPRVGFSDNVEFIPRPLSTISSETESSLSTIRGHSVNNSISSVLSLSTPSPPASRKLPLPLRTASDDDAHPRVKPFSDKIRRNDKEGHWLKRPSAGSLKRPVSEPGTSQPKTTFVESQPTGRSRKRSSTHDLGFGRRRSEPTIGLKARELSGLSTLSLQEPGWTDEVVPERQDSRDGERKSSARKIRDWAAAKISKKTKEMNKAFVGYHGITYARPVSAESTSTLKEATATEPPVAETDLDAVFGNQDNSDHLECSGLQVPTQIELRTPAPDHYNSVRSYSNDESDAVLDLDAALGPFKTPPIGFHRQRKELHSSRLTKDFGGFGGHYHRRSESAPNLPPFEDAQDASSTHPDMADVFEEDEEDVVSPIVSANPASMHLLRESGHESSGYIVDLDAAAIDSSPASRSDDSLGVRGSSEAERPLSSYASIRPVLSSIVFEGRGTSIVEETIFEESAAAGEIDIVDADEEPRASSLTKSSDSSDTPTLLAPPIGTLTFPDGQQSLMTPEAYQTSMFSSPGIGHGLFEQSRLDTAASSMTDNRTLCSSTTGDYGQDLRVSVDVPSLTSSRSTMISTMHGNGSRRDFSDAERAASVTPNPTELYDNSDFRRKRGSIQSLSQLMGETFGSKSRAFHEPRPQTSTATAPEKKEHRLKKLMFWKSKHRSTQPSRPRS